MNDIKTIQPHNIYLKDLYRLFSSGCENNLRAIFTMTNVEFFIFSHHIFKNLLLTKFS